MRTLLFIWILAVALIALTVSSALAAQGQITDVNPSGSDISQALDSSGRVAEGLGGAGVLGLSPKSGDHSGDECPLKQLGGWLIE